MDLYRKGTEDLNNITGLLCGQSTRKPLHEAAGLNESEPTSSTVISPLGNGMNVCAEPILLWRMQNQISTIPVWISGHTGVTGQACGEGYPRENGRDCIAPVRTTVCTELIKHPDVGSNHAHWNVEVTVRIIEREIEPEGMQPVRWVHSRNEVPAMGTDAKEPDFCKCSANSSGPQIHPDVKGGCNI